MPRKHGKARSAAAPFRPVLVHDTATAPFRAKGPDIALKHAMQETLDQAKQLATLVGLARLATRNGLWDQAILAFEQASRLKPSDADIWMDLGYVYQLRRRHQDAIDAYYQAVTLRPEWAGAYTNIGGLLNAVGQVDMAIAASRLAIKLDPNFAGAYLNLASSLRMTKRDEDACEAYRELLSRYPHDAAALVDYANLRQYMCDWDGLAELQAKVASHTYRKGFRVPPFSILLGSDEPLDHLLAGRAWTALWTNGVTKPLASYRPRDPAKRDRRLRIGYLSSDFYNHATALLLVELLELRDTATFEVFGYSAGGIDDGSAIRHRLIAAFDHFADLKSFSHVDAAQRIHADELDILIDLKGYTQDAQTEILSLRPAPIQVNFLGYPGSMGASFIDYVIADRFILPDGSQDVFDERIVRLPECYQPNDQKRPIHADPVTRTGCGLPETGFVFCSFNNPYKITPAIYDIWMGLLRETPGSVLWVLEGQTSSDTNLRREAVARGVAAERIVFAPKMENSRHLARMRLADLFLDTLPINAHTTASDALWAGLPVLTCSGRCFAARVAGSLLHAVGLPELVTQTLGDYAKTALALAHDPAALRVLRDRLDRNRLTEPLFDSPRYTRHFEAALQRMAALRDDGQPPEAFDVPVQG